MPTISRSDGKSFHLLVADRPLPYPAERVAGPTQTVSVCSWYVYGDENLANKSKVAIFEASAGPKEKMYLQIEFIADTLAHEIMRRQELAVFYNLQGNSIFEQSY